ncbi:MAG: alpha/beta hydrolase [Dermatophilus congolensis]|nr:alpha/beta hydrolase [Dermatophilus congolensis]
MPYSRAFVPVDGGRLSAVDFGGRGPDVLFIAGHGYLATSWTQVAAHLGNDIHSVALDHRQHGPGLAPLTTGDNEWLDVVHAIEALGLKNVIVVGHDMGAFMALAAAAERPDLIRGVVTVDGEYADRRGSKRYSAATECGADMLDQLRIRFRFGDVLRGGDQVADYLAQMRHVAETDWLVRGAGPQYEADAQYALRELPDGSLLRTPSPDAVVLGYEFSESAKYHPSFELYGHVTVPIDIMHCRDGNASSDTEMLRILAGQHANIHLHIVASGTVPQYACPQNVAEIVLEANARTKARTGW